ncbi:MAG: tRNA lysidine(34) synthetase TilS [Chloroflexi bacterium]|nr:tRNA lysidine(34) synthetase TilS [Chloroflexota bacterium]
MNWTADILSTWHNGRVSPTTPLVVGVSGGVDSLVLLHLFAHLPLHPREQLTAVYIHHGLRPEADDEADMVQATAAQWGIASRVVRVEIPPTAASWEEAARQARYRALGQVAAELGGHLVATAHHADDQAETILLNLLRGTGLGGLRGMRPWSDLPEWGPPQTLVRPLLTIWRTQIEAYARAHGLHPTQDPSNQDTAFARNRIRHELLPTLHGYNPQVAQHLVQMGELLAADYEIVQAAVGKAWADWAVADGGLVVLDATGWRQSPLAVRRELLREAVAAVCGHKLNLSFAVVETAQLALETGTANTQTQLPHGAWAALHHHMGREVILVWVGDAAVLTDWLAQNQPQLLEAIPMPLAVPGAVQLANGWRLTAAPFLADAIAPPPTPWQVVAVVSAEAQLVVRPRVAGELFRPLGGVGSAKLKKVMNACHIPAPLREKWPVVADEQGLLWLVGHRLAQRAGETAVAPHRILLQLHKSTS